MLFQRFRAWFHGNSPKIVASMQQYGIDRRQSILSIGKTCRANSDHAIDDLFDETIIEFVGGPFDGLRKPIEPSEKPSLVAELPVSASILQFVFGNRRDGDFEASGKAIYQLQRRGSCWKYDFAGQSKWSQPDLHSV